MCCLSLIKNLSEYMYSLPTCQDYSHELSCSVVLQRREIWIPCLTNKKQLWNVLGREIVFFRCWTKLVYSFNHCQFICCGIIKKILKDFINEQSSSPKLCSYFRKNSIFCHSVWQNLDMDPRQHFCCFRNCFKLLNYWVQYR